VHEHAAAVVDALLDEGVALGKVLQQILVVVVIHLDHQVAVGGVQLQIQGLAQGRHDVGDVGRLQGISAAHRYDSDMP
jgi:hypothetical protein